MLKKLMAGTAASFLLLGASDAMARSVDAWVVVGLNSSSGMVEDQVTSDLCMGAVAELRELGFAFKAMSELEPRLNVLYFQKSGDAVALFCLANVFEEQFGIEE
jgi:hypothetical protein